MKTSRWAIGLWLFACAAGLTFAGQDAAKSAQVEADQLDAQIGVLYKQQQFDKAITLAQRELSLREKAVGPDHPAVGDVSRNLGELYFAKGKYREAKAAYQRFLQIYDVAYGADSPKLLDGLYRYVCVLIALNQRPEALDVQKHAFRIENGFDFEKLTVQKNKNLTESGLMIGLMTFGPTPPYPQDAKNAGIAGSVIIKMSVEETGQVSLVNVLSGHPLLTGQSELAARRSTYAPALQAGAPVRVTALLIYNFGISLTNNRDEHLGPTSQD